MRRGPGTQEKANAPIDFFCARKIENLIHNSLHKKWWIHRAQERSFGTSLDLHGNNSENSQPASAY
jgi:hypothetical protein